MIAVDPIRYASSWNVILVAGAFPSPGFCVLSGFDRSAEFDEKKGKGTKGATLTYVQAPLAEGEIEFFLWDNGTLGTGHDHFAEWSAFRELLKYDPTKKKVEAVSIYHPALADQSITSVVCEHIGMLTRTRELMYSVKCKFKEYTPPPKTSAVGTASGAKKNPGADAAAHAQAAGDAATQALKEALDAPTQQEKELDKLWSDYNSGANG